MKPRFAIRFSDDGVALLHREGQGWAEIASTVVDRPDFDAAMRWLQVSARELSPDGFTTLLVLPDSQILYTRVYAPAPVEAARREKIAAALEGRTPYAVADLAFDWVGDGDYAKVAVIARETLDEAETFASAHGMNPVAFAAAPDFATFPGVPFFGQTGAAETLIGPGETVEPEDMPLALVPLSFPDTDEGGTEETAPSAPDEAQENPTPADAPDVPEEWPTPPDEPATPEPLPETPEELPPEPEDPTQEPEPLPIPVREPEPTREPEPVEVPEPDPLPEQEPDDPYPEPADLPAFDPLPEPVTMAEPAAPVRAALLGAPAGDPASADADEAPMALDVPVDPDPQPYVTKGPSVTSAEALSLDETPSAPTAAASLAFASRRSVAASVTSAAGRPVGPASQPDIPKPPTPQPSLDRPEGLRPTPKTDYAKGEANSVKDAGSRALRGIGALVAAPPVTGMRRAKVMIPPSVKARGTTAGAGPTQQFRSRPAPQRGKPKHLGLILTGILLLCLALAAALSSIYIAQNDAEQPDTAIAAATSAPDAAAQDIPDVTDEMLADGIDPDEVDAAPTDPAPIGAVADVAGTDTAAADDTVTTDAATTVSPEVETVASAPAPDPAPAITADTAPAPVVASAPAEAGQPVSTASDEITLSAADNAPQTARALILPVPEARGDLLPDAQTTAPPYGTVYQFDANGLIRPTPEGIVTPEGVLLIAGKPPLLPPVRPEGLAPAATLPAETGADVFDAALVNPALSGARPRLRPDGLVPASALTVADQQAVLVPVSAATETTPRPTARPASILTAGLEAQQAALAAASLVTPDPNRSVLALAVSRRPAPRPADMARAVEAAVAAAARQPEPEQVAAAASLAPEEIVPEAEAEPELAAAAPSIPSSANIAKQATLRNAINLSELNLIGVYGTQSNRYALVRQPNGRYVKVTVGDRLDGGRVAAITASEVRYEKRGRMMVLEMPSG